MIRQIKFRAQRSDNKEFVYGFYYKGLRADQNTLEVPLGCAQLFDSIITEQGVIYDILPSTVGQFTGLLDKNGKEIYEGDIIRQRTPERSYQEHYGENIPTPSNVYFEQLECYIKTSYRSVIFSNGAFILSEENPIDEDYTFPMGNELFFYDKESMIRGFEECKSRISWDEPEEGDLQYLLNEYNLKSEEELIKYLGIEVVGNIHQNPELLK